MPEDFAHPVERALADVLDAHGIAWEYEPHTLALERDESGRPRARRGRRGSREAVTPDLILPDLGLYLECTVTRQSLTPRAPQGAPARERAGASVGIPFRRDLDRLAMRWGLTELAEAGRVGGCVSAAVGAGTGRRDMTESARMLDTRGDFRVDVAQEGEASVVSVGGDVDLHSAPVLRVRLAALADAHAGHVVLDLSDATFLDSMALGVILAAKKRQTAARGRLDLVVATHEIRRIFEITMLDEVFDIHETRADAIGSADGFAG